MITADEARKCMSEISTEHMLELNEWIKNAAHAGHRKVQIDNPFRRVTDEKMEIVLNFLKEKGFTIKIETRDYSIKEKKFLGFVYVHAEERIYKDHYVCW